MCGDDAGVPENNRMDPEANDLVRRALALPEEDRAELASLLIESLDKDLEIDQDYELEIRLRVAASDRGDVQRIPWEEARKRIFFGGDDEESR